MELLVSALAVAAALAVTVWVTFARTRGLNAQVSDLQAELVTERERANAAEASTHELSARMGEIGVQLAENK